MLDKKALSGKRRERRTHEISPAQHRIIKEDRYVGRRDIVVGAEVAVGGAEPVVEAVFERQELRPVTEVPGTPRWTGNQEIM